MIYNEIEPATTFWELWKLILYFLIILKIYSLAHLGEIQVWIAETTLCNFIMKNMLIQKI
jgi:hypothetical protein